MNILEAEILIQEYLTSNWSITPIVYPNTLPAAYAAPGMPILPQGDTDYIALRYSFEQSRFITVPGTCRRYTGTIQFSLFTRVYQENDTYGGSYQLAKYASDLIDLFEGKEIRNTGNEILRVWGLTGSVELSYDEWYARELAFSASFERYVS